MSASYAQRSPQLIVALDVPNMQAALDIVGRLEGRVRFFKVGSELFTTAGPDVIKQVRARGAYVFLDLKFHDIPNTVARVCRVAARYGVYMLTVHAAGGPAMVQAAAEAVRHEAGDERPRIIAVTVLTSIDDRLWRDQLGMGSSVSDSIVSLAQMAYGAGADGVVASPKDLVLIRESCGEELLIVTPGVRPTGAVTGDQARVATPADAVRDGADFLVVGRPIVAAQDPTAAAAAILAEMESAHDR